MYVFIYLLTLLIHFYNVSTANILGLFPHTGKSHHMVFEPLLHELAKRGHNVTVTSFYPSKKPPPNYHDISFRGMYELRLESFDLNIFEVPSILDRIPKLGKMMKQVLQLQPFAVASGKICEKLVNFSPLINVLRDDYDAVILENFTSDCMLGLLYAYGITAPVISILSGTPMPWTVERVGATDNPSYVPTITAPLSSRMSLTDRLENTLVNVALKKWFYNEIQTKERAIIEKKFGRIPDLVDLGKNVSLVLTNSYYTLTGVKPLVPALVEVGGLHLDFQKQHIPKVTYHTRFLFVVTTYLIKLFQAF